MSWRIMLVTNSVADLWARVVRLERGERKTR